MGENMLNYKNIATNYGETAVLHMKLYAKLLSQLCKQKNRRIFLLRCKNDDIIPTFLKFKTTHITFNCKNLERRFNEYIIKTFTKNTLNILITDTTKNVHTLQEKILKSKNHLQLLLARNILDEFINKEALRIDKIFENIKLKNIKKFSRLKNKDVNLNTSNWIENLTEVNIPDCVTEILSLGPNFAVPLKSADETRA